MSQDILDAHNPRLLWHKVTQFGIRDQRSYRLRDLQVWNLLLIRLIAILNIVSSHAEERPSLI
jgi:hypothetical protein